MCYHAGNEYKVSFSMNLFASIGNIVINICSNLGGVLLFFLSLLVNILHKDIRAKNVLRQIIHVGFYSLPIVGLTAVFTGAVMCLQTYSGFAELSSESTIASIIVVSVTRELGPVITGLVVAGRVSAAMASEISSMKISQQLDALRSMSINPKYYLVIPKLIASVVSLPFLVITADIIGILGGYLVAVNILEFSAVSYISNTILYLEYSEVTAGLIKAVVFGAVIALSGCYTGINSGNSSIGVGRATTNAVVISSMSILLFNYLLTLFLFGI